MWLPLREKKKVICIIHYEQTPEKSSEGFLVQEESDEGSFPRGSSSEQYSLEQQRRTRLNQEKEEEKLRQQEAIATENQRKRQENERMKRKDLVS